MMNYQQGRAFSSPKPLFFNQSAWFSGSCDTESSKKWVQNGGKLEDPSIAQFIFSDDWDHEDTKGFLTSSAYLKQHLAVFKSRFVLETVENGPRDVSLGNYLLVPPSVLKCIASAKLDLSDENSSTVNGDTTSNKSPRRVLRKRKEPQDNQSRQTSSKANVSLLPHTSGQRNGTIGCTPPHRPQTRRSLPKETHLENTVKGRHQFDKMDLANIVHIDDLPKVTGPLRIVSLNNVMMRKKAGAL
ncbi:hypothetical protein EGW08_013300 [Elysia chlorotica]|uniref:Uncharacterized protein n=1 Tax=Elysia chlorotica TaxID=188477 RepID=A0A3S1HGI5_ELYCH|nr:hypothetical protein EGW08_013300 [Elysia chlorotica]